MGGDADQRQSLGAPVIDAGLFRAQGFVLAKGFFDPEEVRRIHEEAKAVFAAQMRRHRLLPDDDVDEATFTEAMFRLFEVDLPAFANCGKQVQHLISLHRLSLDERIVGALAELGLDFPNVSTRPVLYFNHPRLAKKEVYWRLSLHQDWRSMQGSLDSTVVWLPLVDIDKSVGALEVIPGSHRRGLLEADLEDGYGHISRAAQAEVDESELVSVEVERGDALFFSTFLLHQSGTNVSDRLRWSCHFRYNNLAEPTFVDRGYPHPYIYRPGPEILTPGFPTEDDIERTFGREAAQH
jgi:phytanoyl-CoA hydroxylase